MSEIDGLRERVEAARRQFAVLSRRGWGEPGPADEQTGERWDRGHVLGHVAEMVPYWTGQVRDVLGGAEAMGRDDAGNARRRAGIDTGRDAGEEGLLGRVDAGMAGLLALLGDMHDADLDRRVVLRSHSGDHPSDLRAAIQMLLVGHLEEHVGQLSASSP
jgi:hypothetical protein